MKSTEAGVKHVTHLFNAMTPITLGIEKTKGSLDVGKDADIIITDSEFNVEKTIIGGEIRYEA